MAIAKIEAELAAVTARIERLEAELEKAREWQSELITSLRVLGRIGGRHDITSMPLNNAPSTATMPTSPNASGGDTQPTQVTQTRRRRRDRSEVVRQAEKALVEILRTERRPIKQLDAVQRLREHYNIVVGAGIPGRETSDLSAALGNGKSALLTVTRRHGWELTEWSGLPSTNHIPAPEDEIADGVTSEDIREAQEYERDYGDQSEDVA